MPAKAVNNTVSVDLSHYVDLYGVDNFDKVLAQVLKGFVDMGQYPQNIPDHETLAKEIHKTLSSSGMYVSIKAGNHHYQLMITEPRKHSGIIYKGLSGHVFVPEPIWWVLDNDAKTS